MAKPDYESPPAPAPQENLLAIGAMILTGVAAAFSTVVLPLMVSAVAAAFDVPGKQAAWIASSEMGGVALGAFWAGLRVAKADRRRLVQVGAIIAVASNLLSAGVDSLWTLLVIRVLAGTGAGVLLATASAELGGTRDPERNFALFVVGAFVSASLGFRLLSPLVAQGTAPLFLVIAALSAGALAASACFPTGLRVFFATEALAARWGTAVLTAMAGILGFYLGVGSVWPLMGTIGEDAGRSSSEIAAVLADASLAGMAGALAAAVLASRLGRLVPLVGGLALVTGSLLMLALVGAPAFATAPLAFLFAWNFSFAYMAGTLAFLDPSGRAVALNMTLQYIGFGTGPLVGSVFIAINSPSSLPWVGVAGSGAALLLFPLALRLARARHGQDGHRQ